MNAWTWVCVWDCGGEGEEGVEEAEKNGTLTIAHLNGELLISFPNTLISN